MSLSVTRVCTAPALRGARRVTSAGAQQQRRHASISANKPGSPFSGGKGDVAPTPPTPADLAQKQHEAYQSRVAFEENTWQSGKHSSDATSATSATTATSSDATAEPRGTANDEAESNVQRRELREVLLKSREQLLEEADRQLTKWEDIKGKVGVWWQDTKHHFVHGTKELARNVRLSWGYMVRSLHGHNLSRRERRLMSRTLGDLFRIVPFSMFVIIPAAELLLPVALKVFPNMLPSTYDDPNRINEKYQKRLAAHVELTKFMHDTLEEMTVQVQKDSASDEMRQLASEFGDYLLTLRTSKEPLQMHYTQLRRLLPLFNQDLGLNKMRRAQLIAMCKLLETPHFSLASEESLRIGLRMHLRRLKRDDILIEREGIESLDDKEVIQACKMRAIKVPKGADIEELRKELGLWITLSRQPGVSNSMLLFSRVLPLHSIRKMAAAAARDYGQKQVDEIEKRAELKAHQDENMQYWRTISNEWERLSTVEEEQEGPSINTNKGSHIFMLSFGEVEHLRRKERALQSIAEEIESLQDTAEEIEELKGESIEFKAEAERSGCDRTTALLGNRIARSISLLEHRLATEEMDVIIQRARGIVDGNDSPVMANAAPSDAQPPNPALREAVPQSDHYDPPAPNRGTPISKPGGVSDVVQVTAVGGDSAEKLQGDSHVGAQSESSPSNSTPAFSANSL